MVKEFVKCFSVMMQPEVTQISFETGSGLTYWKEQSHKQMKESIITHDNKCSCRHWWTSSMWYRWSFRLSFPLYSFNFAVICWFWKLKLSQLKNHTRCFWGWDIFQSVSRLRTEEDVFRWERWRSHSSAGFRQPVIRHETSFGPCAMTLISK